MATVFHKNDYNFLCTVITTEYSSLFKRTIGNVADSNYVAVTISIYLLYTPAPTQCMCLPNLHSLPHKA